MDRLVGDQGTELSMAHLRSAQLGAIVMLAVAILLGETLYGAIDRWLLGHPQQHALVLPIDPLDAATPAIGLRTGDFGASSAIGSPAEKSLGEEVAEEVRYLTSRLAEAETERARLSRQNLELQQRLVALQEAAEHSTDLARQTLEDVGTKVRAVNAALTGVRAGAGLQAPAAPAQGTDEKAPKSAGSSKPDAIAFLKAARRVHGDRPELLRALARLCFAQGDARQSEALLRKILAQAPTNAPGRVPPLPAAGPIGSIYPCLGYAGQPRSAGEGPAATAGAADAQNH